MKNTWFQLWKPMTNPIEVNTSLTGSCLHLQVNQWCPCQNAHRCVLKKLQKNFYYTASSKFRAQTLLLHAAVQCLAPMKGRSMFDQYYSVHTVMQCSRQTFQNYTQGITWHNLLLHRHVRHLHWFSSCSQSLPSWLTTSFITLLSKYLFQFLRNSK